MGTKTEKPLVLFTKTENQTLKNEKSANRNDHQNRKTEVFCNKNRKTDLKNSQNRKTENPNAPLVLLTRHAVREGTPDEALRTLAYEQAINLGESREDTRE